MSSPAFLKGRFLFHYMWQSWGIKFSCLRNDLWALFYLLGYQSQVCNFSVTTPSLCRLWMGDYYNETIIYYKIKPTERPCDVREWKWLVEGLVSTFMLILLPESNLIKNCLLYAFCQLCWVSCRHGTMKV